jgi:hypothetical protein
VATISGSGDALLSTSSAPAWKASSILRGSTLMVKTTMATAGTSSRSSLATWTPSPLGNPRYTKSTLNGERQARVEELIRLLDEWMDDDSSYDEETWPELKAGLERNRLSSRRLFDD